MRVKVYVINNGQKTLFYEGELNELVVKQIKAEVKWYFGWRRISALCQGKEVYLFDGDKVRKRVRMFSKEASM